eukprot:927308-Rhodomonas_salina.2
MRKVHAISKRQVPERSVFPRQSALCSSGQSGGRSGPATKMRLWPRIAVGHCWSADSHRVSPPLTATRHSAVDKQHKPESQLGFSASDAEMSEKELREKREFRSLPSSHAHIFRNQLPEIAFLVQNVRGLWFRIFDLALQFGRVQHPGL